MIPIVRGKCNSCGWSRNLWLNELNDLPLCAHGDMGCYGRMEVAYVGPKAFLSADLDRAHMECSCTRRPQASHVACIGPAARGQELTQLLSMGFPEDAAGQALAEVDSQGNCGTGRIEAAIDILMVLAAQPSMPPRTAAGNASCSSAVASNASCSSAAGAAAQEEACICAICTEDMEPANAAMRCSGQHGKRHYYHAWCLSQWIQQCQRDNLPPTCPECRGELQVRAKRLGDFLAEKSSSMSRSDVEALRAVHDAAMAESDEDGWSGIKKDTLIKGIAVGAGIAVAGLAIAAAMGAFKNDSRDERRRR